MRLPFRIKGTKLRWAAAILAVAFGVFALLGFLLGPGLLKGWLEREIEKVLDRKVEIRRVQFDPFLLELDLEGLTVRDHGGTLLFTAERLVLDFEKSSLTRGTPICSRVLCTRPRLRLVREGAGKWNITDLVESWTRKDGPPPPFSLATLQVEGGGINIEDRPSGRSFSLDDVTFWLPGLSSLPGERTRPATPRLTGTVLGSPIRVRGRWMPWSAGPEGTVELTFSDLAPASLPSGPAFRLPPDLAAGALRGRVGVDVTPLEPGGPLLEFSADLSLSTPLPSGVERTAPGAPPLMTLRGGGSWMPSSGEVAARAELNLSDMNLPRLLTKQSGQPSLRVTSGRIGGMLLGRFTLAAAREPSLELSGELHVTGFKLAEPASAPFLSAPRVDIRLASAEPLARKYSIENIDLASPHLRGESDFNGQIARILKAAGTGAPQEGKAFQVTAGKVRVRNGRVSFQDLPPGEELLTELDEVALQAGPFSNGASGPAHFEIASRTTYGARVGAKGTLSQGAGPIVGSYHLDGLPMVRAASLAPEGMPIHIRDGVAEMGGSFRYGPSPGGGGLILSDTWIRARSILITNPSGAELLAVPEVDLDGVQIDPDRRFARATIITCREGRARIQRDAEGRWNILPPPKPSAPELAVPWSFTADEVELADWEVRFADWSPDEPAGLAAERLDLWMRDFSTARCATSSIALRANFEGGGSATASGSAGMDPGWGEMEFTLKEIPISMIQPYVSQRLNVEIQEGILSSSGRLRSIPREGATSPGVRFEGDLLITRFRAVDKERWDDLLVWDTLHLGGVTLASAPPRTVVDEAALSNFYARAVVLPDATLNLFHLWKVAPAAASPPAAAPETAATGRIEQVVVQNGTVDFTDTFIYPSYTASLNDVTGRLSGFDSMGGSAGDLELRGHLGIGAPLEIAGMANPFRNDLFADIRASCHNVDLLPFSAYAGKYAGYAIAGGKLDLEVTYHMENRRLEAHSRIFLDQFALGDKIEGGGNSGLPMKLAVALLKNQKGEIRIDVPITGSLDDLQVDLKPLMGGMFRRMVTKVLAWPFATIGRIFRRGPELSSVEFVAGRFEIGTPGLQTLARTGEKLAARPNMRIQVAGLFEPQTDEEGLKKALVERRVLAEKAAALRRLGTPGDDAAIVLGPGEYDLYLGAIYRKQEIPKPRGEDGLPKDIPTPEMEKLLMAYTEVGLGELRHLAQGRAEAVRAALLAAGARANQIYIVDPDSLPPEAQEGRRNRAAFALK
jgi:hypothetical protein